MYIHTCTVYSIVTLFQFETEHAQQYRTTVKKLLVTEDTEANRAMNSLLKCVVLLAVVSVLQAKPVAEKGSVLRKGVGDMWSNCSTSVRNFL